MSIKNKQQAFTLVEVAIVLVIVGLLLAGGINLMSASSDSVRYKESQNNLNDVKETLQSLYLTKRFLPCPDTNNPPDGFGNYADGTGVGAASANFATGTGTTTSACASPRGWLPFNDLGIGGNGDTWGERIKYVVSGEFTAAASNTFCSDYNAPSHGRNVAANQITVQDLQATPATLGDWAAFALVSTGKNGRQTNSLMTGAFTNDGGCATLNAREQENCDTDSILRFGNQMSDGTTVTFDDMVVWVGDYQLISELRKSGVCSAAAIPPPSSPTVDPTNRTTTDFTANSGQSFSGNYENHDNANTSNAADKVTISGNLEKDINLQDGNNTLSINGNAEANITAGSGNDVVRVKGNLQRAVNLGTGDDYLEVWGNTTGSASVDMGAGNDSVRVEGNISAPIELGSGTNSIYVGGNINAAITATGGSAMVYYEGASMSVAEKSRVSGLSPLMCRAHSTDTWATCP
jgi:prepilin-type N-terminal cleavage/methylation domain-containing protein